MRKMIPAFLFLLLIRVLAVAQRPQGSWDNLRHLMSGDRVEVVDTKIKTFSGKFASFTDQSKCFSAVFILNLHMRGSSWRIVPATPLPKGGL